MAQDSVNPERDDNDEPVWTVAGYSDFDGVYHDFEDTDPFDKGDWYSESDLVTISWIDSDNGETQYARLVGPFEDYDDLDDRVDTYFEEGTP